MLPRGRAQTCGRFRERRDAPASCYVRGDAISRGWSVRRVGEAVRTTEGRGMTPAEAATKWCPHKRVALENDDGGVSANWTGNMKPDGDGYGNLYASTRCEGPGCMMWRLIERGP